MAINRNLVSDDTLNEVVHRLRNKMTDRLAQKGHYGFIGPHEALGIITEEYWELIEAVKNNGRDAFKHELLDVAVAAVFAYASALQDEKVNPSLNQF